MKGDVKMIISKNCGVTAPSPESLTGILKEMVAVSFEQRAVIESLIYRVTVKSPNLREQNPLEENFGLHEGARLANKLASICEYNRVNTEALRQLFGRLADELGEEKLILDI